MASFQGHIFFVLKLKLSAFFGPYHASPGDQLGIMWIIVPPGV